MRIEWTRTVKAVLLAAAVCLGAAASLQAADFVSVSKSGVNLRSGPGTNYSILFELPERYPLKVVDRKGQWLKVSDFENDEGWIYEPLVSDERYVIVTVEEGNVRSGPSINNRRIGSVVREVILRQIGRDGDWIQFEHPQLTGWIHRKLVWP